MARRLFRTLPYVGIALSLDFYVWDHCLAAIASIDRIAFWPWDEVVSKNLNVVRNIYIILERMMTDWALDTEVAPHHNLLSNLRNSLDLGPWILLPSTNGVSE
jgi:hypothetical protein